MDEYLELLEACGPLKAVTEKQLNSFAQQGYTIIQKVRTEEEEPSESDIYSVFDYIKEQAESEDFPTRLTPGSNLANLVVKHLVEVSQRVEDEDFLDEQCNNLFMAALQGGPNLGQMALMDQIRNEHSLKKYWKELGRSDTEDAILAIKGDYLPSENEDRGYGEMMTSAVVTFFLREFTDEQVEEAKDPLVELWFDSKLHVIKTTNQESQLVHGAITSEISRKRKGRIYEKLDRERVIEENIESLERIVTDKKFPSHEVARNTVDDVMDEMVASMKVDDRLRDDFGLEPYLKLLLKLEKSGNKNAKEIAQKRIPQVYELWPKQANKIEPRSKTGAKVDSIETLLTACREVSSPDDAEQLKKNYKDLFDELLPKLSSDKKDACFDFLCVCLEKSWEYLMEMARKLIKKKKIFNWKDKPEWVSRIFDIYMKLTDLEADGDRSFSGYTDVMEEFLKQLKSQKQTAAAGDRLYQLVKVCLAKIKERHKDIIVYHAVCCSTDHVPWKSDIKYYKEALNGMYEAVTSFPDMPQSCHAVFFLQLLSTHLFRALMDGPDVGKIVPEVTKIFLFCKDQDFDDPEKSDEKSIHWTLCKDIMEDYIYRHKEQTEVVRPVLQAVKELWECGDEIMERDANNIMSGITDVELLGDDATVLIDKYLSGEDVHLIAQFQQMAEKSPDIFKERIDEFMGVMANTDGWIQTCTMGLFYTLAKDDPHVFSNKQVARLCDFLEDDDTCYQAFFIMQTLSSHRPKDLFPFDDKIIKAAKAKANLTGQLGMVLAPLGTVDEEHARKYIGVIFDVMLSCDVMLQMSLLFNIKTIGVAFPEVLGEFRDKIEEKKTNPQLKDYAQAAIDVIEGRSLEGLSQDVSEQKEEIDKLDERVTTTEENVDNIGKEVNKNKKDIKYIKEDVTKAEHRIDELETVVDETVEKVDEIDQKSLSHAPAWSRDVSKLLNPEAEHDWRLLASRLGYSAEDVRNWATQPDPCMSMLNEWFATHKTSEATFGVLNALREINRPDATEIVQQALKSVEGVIEEEPEEISEPPPVFISYQWGHQQEVKLLKKHLEMAGFPAWVDIGQMGGGDKLFAKIDHGIRAAKVIICCVSNKYAESANCTREVNLSATLGKPVIPLLMEKMSWPPPGAMGPIFGEYLFIRFFARSGESASDERYWPLPKFQELLMQLGYYVAPKEDMISGEYTNWWNPPEEEIIINQKNQTTGQPSGTSNQTAASLDSQETTSPAVFVSYQWGKQPQVRALYRRLSKLGFSCWMDIFQMGGGDSLYEKIDKGIRGCKVMLSCVTTKYSMSANCRREVSLADAVKKPIIPLLLEDIQWPPEGPMSMVFTHLLYINFSKPSTDIQNSWLCEQFEELVQQLAPHVLEENEGASSVEASGGGTDKPKLPDEPDAQAEQAGVNQNNEQQTLPSPEPGNKNSVSELMTDNIVHQNDKEASVMEPSGGGIEKPKSPDKPKAQAEDIKSNTVHQNVDQDQTKQMQRTPTKSRKNTSSLSEKTPPASPSKSPGNEPKKSKSCTIL